MKLLLIMIGILVAIQAIRPEKTNPPIDENIALKAATPLMHVLKKSCFDCHSYKTKWPWYAQIAPLSWSIVSHVNDGRKALNFSEWEKIPTKIKIKRLKRMKQTTNNGMMPLSSYLLLHKEATLTSEDKTLIKEWCDKTLKSLE